MLHGDKNVLKAKLQKGYFDLQFQLIDLYVGNLQAFGEMAAFTAGCAYTSIGEITIPKTGTFTYAFQYLFDIFIHVTLALSVFATSQAALVLVFGPTKGFCGQNVETVKIVQTILLEQRNLIMLIFLAMLGTTYASLIMNFICKIPWESSTSTSFVFLFGFILTLICAAYCYSVFNPTGAMILDGSNVTRKSFFTDQFPGVKYSHAALGSAEEDSVDQIIEELRRRIKKFKANGIIFWRQDLDDNSPLKERYASLANGKLDIYKNEEEFDNNENPLNEHPFDLSQYAVETDYNKFPKGNVTAGTFINRAFAGQGEFSALNIATSNYDLVHASKNFRFFLIPRVINETKPLKLAEFMSTDEESHKKWLSAFRKSCRNGKNLDDLLQLSAEEFDSGGGVDVEMVLANSLDNVD